MKMNYRILFCALAAFSFLQSARAQQPVHDSVDVLHYDLTFDMGNRVAKQLQGEAEITFVKTRDCGQVTFDLIADSIHPVWLDGSITRGYDFDRDNRLVTVYVGGQPGDTHVVRIPYFSHGYVESYGIGGLHMDNGIHYNLGAVFMESPHCFGRSLYPCRDNFHDKATYTYRVTSKPGWRSLCSGMKVSAVTNADGSLTEVWEVRQNIPTYISSVSSAPWHVIECSYLGADGRSYPATLGYGNHDSSRVVRHFEMLNQVMPMFERCFGPYRWERIGYIATEKGSMEHAQNIALVSVCMADVSNLQCEMTTCHELAHAWFGNLITCTTQGDMWINEGGASFCEEVANEAIHGKASSITYYQDKLKDVILNTHHSDGGYRALHDMSERYTYGSTTYDKGALVWHSPRGYLGDTLFYRAMRRLFASCAFGNLDAYALRDSLSLYTGTDLTGFFDFHVFNPGFVDYEMQALEVDGTRATVTLRQRLRGTTTYARDNQVPVAFFSHSLQRADRLMTFDDSVGTETFGLPFVPAFAVVDIDHQLSDAVTDTSVSLKTKGARPLPQALCRVSVGENTADPHAWVHIGHHYVTPSGSLPEGVDRIAPRYWQVAGIIPWDVDVIGSFLYNRGSHTSAGACNVDEGFYENIATLDSLGVLYRPDPSQPWQLVSRLRLASSTTSSGYFKTRLFPGQYTLGVVDTNLVSIASPEARENPRLRLTPNPAGSEFRVDAGTHDKKFDLCMYDTSGRKVLEMRNVGNGDVVRHGLPAGTYVVLIQNKFVSLQSQIVVQ